MCVCDITLNMKQPKTLQQAIVYFSDQERAFEYAKNLRWPDGNVTCPRCGISKNSFVKTRHLWFCYGCKRQFTIKVKTIMEDSPIGLDKWMTAFWLLANAKNGISSHELARALGVTQTTAWFMLQRIREVMKVDRSYKFGGSEGGPVESDETFIGPNPYKMHRGRKLELQRGRGQGRRYGYVDMALAPNATYPFTLIDQTMADPNRTSTKPKVIYWIGRFTYHDIFGGPLHTTKFCVRFTEGEFAICPEGNDMN
jgi:transposase-like protein